VLPVGNVNASDTDTTLARRAASYVDGKPHVIRLAIRSKDLMVSGRFDHWVPVAMEGNGAEGAAQLFFDVTGMSRGPEDGELFSFESDKVKRLGGLAFVATGTLQQGDVKKTVDAVVQTPMAHTPFLAVTFPLDASIFSEIWTDLSALVAARTDGNTQMSPRAWLRTPTLGTA
jgi:hypothetical protein